MPLAAICDAADAEPAASTPERETDPRKLEQRQKQIDYGKNTLGYQNYVKLIPK